MTGPVVPFASAFVGQFAARIVGDLRVGAVSLGPADRTDGEVKDRHFKSNAHWLAGKKGGCPASGSEPYPPTAETHLHREETPAMRKCASPFSKGSGSLATSFPGRLLTGAGPTKVDLSSPH